MSGSYTRIGLDEDRDGARTDWTRLQSLSDADIDAAIAGDPDSYPVETDLIGRRGGSYAYQLHQDGTGAWRWALRSAAGEVLAVSGKAFASRAAAEAALTDLLEALLGARSEAA